KRQIRKDRCSEVCGGYQSHALRKNRVGPHRKVAMLFGGSDRQHDPVVVTEVLLEHLPVAVMDPHPRLPRPPARSRAIAYDRSSFGRVEARDRGATPGYGFGDTVTVA